jgi:2-oxoglutarate ferredoxin oxidoreductase subunit delta
VTTKDLTKNKLPVFMLKRCKQCGICSHFCPTEALTLQKDGTPFLVRPEACNSCGLCEDMCPDWAVCLSPVDLGEADEESS